MDWIYKKTRMHICGQCGQPLSIDHNCNGYIEEIVFNISLCKNCWCITKTIKGMCGKCGAKKTE